MVKEMAKEQLYLASQSNNEMVRFCPPSPSFNPDSPLIFAQASQIDSITPIPIPVFLNNPSPSPTLKSFKFDNSG